MLRWISSQGVLFSSFGAFQAARRQSKTLSFRALAWVDDHYRTSAPEILDKDETPPEVRRQLLRKLDVLHQRLVAAKDAIGIRYITWLCKGYSGYLRRRREDTLNAVLQRDNSMA